MNGEGKIVVEISNRTPVQLIDLTQSLISFAKEYQGFADSEFEGDYRTETHLYVKEIRTGSIITELVPYAAGLLPFLSDTNTVIGFVKHLKAAVDKLRTPKEPGTKTDLSRTTLTNIASIVDPIAKDNGSQINISGETINIAPVYLTVNSTDANIVQNQAARELALLRAPLVGLHENVVMYWYQARNDPTSKAGDKAIIESISSRPVKVVFATEKIKAEMLRLDENIFRHAFIVDVHVETVENRPMLYKVMQVHEEIERD